MVYEYIQYTYDIMSGALGTGSCSIGIITRRTRPVVQSLIFVVDSDMADRKVKAESEATLSVALHSTH